MWAYTLLLHSATPLDEIDGWLVARFGEPDERGSMRHGALSVAVWDPDPLSADDFDHQLDGPVTGDISWFVENRGDPDACDEAMRTLFVAVPQLTIEFDASVLFLWERDVVYMARVGGEMIIYDRCHEWFRPDVEPFLPPHTVSSEYRLA